MVKEIDSRSITEMCVGSNPIACIVKVLQKRARYSFSFRFFIYYNKKIELFKLYFMDSCVFPTFNENMSTISSVSSTSSLRSWLTESQKYLLLVRQGFQCKGIQDYTCPIKNKLFDEAGYDVDHILPLIDGGTNDPMNLQALCPSCHRVKTVREHQVRSIRAEEIKQQSHLDEFLTKYYRICLKSINTIPFSEFWKEFNQWEIATYHTNSKRDDIRTEMLNRCGKPSTATNLYNIRRM